MKSKRIIFIIFIAFFQFCTNEKEACRQEYEPNSHVQLCTVMIGYIVQSDAENRSRSKNINIYNIIVGSLIESCFKAYEQKQECDRKSEYIPTIGNW